MCALIIASMHFHIEVTSYDFAVCLFFLALRFANRLFNKYSMMKKKHETFKT